MQSSMVRLLTLSCSMVLVLGTAMAAERKGRVPTTVQSLWVDYDPTQEPLNAEVVRQWREGDVPFRYVTYRIGTFKGAAATMAAFTSAAIKEADPEAKVLIGGLEIPFDDFRQRIYEREQLPILRELKGKWIDILDLHWFGHLDESQKLPKAIERVRQDLRECGFQGDRKKSTSATASSLIDFGWGAARSVGSSSLGGTRLFGSHEEPAYCAGSQVNDR